MRDMTPEEITRRALEGLKRLSADLEAGRPLRATRVQRYETPDGPMHTRVAGEYVQIDTPDGPMRVFRPTPPAGDTPP